jgi:hypothetical protein
VRRRPADIADASHAFRTTDAIPVSDCYEAMQAIRSQIMNSPLWHKADKAPPAMSYRGYLPSVLR